MHQAGTARVGEVAGLVSGDDAAPEAPFCGLLAADESLPPEQAALLAAGGRRAVPSCW